jgi:DNA polymerase-4
MNGRDSEIERKIIHIDMDAFYASVEQRDDPGLKGKAVIVGWNSPRGVVCAASYEARGSGVRSAMAMVKARELCPRGVFINPRMERYSEVSRQINACFKEYTDLVEPLSLDEAFLDVTDNKKGIPYASTIARELKERIKGDLGLTASAGVAPNKFIAKIASDMEKPDGLVVVTPEQVEGFLRDLPVGAIHGVGSVTEGRLRQLGIHTIGQLARMPAAGLEAEFGKMGAMLHELANGRDRRPVDPDREHKSIGHETTFERDLVDEEEILAHLRKLAGDVETRLGSCGMRGRTVTLKVKYHDFTLNTRSRTLPLYIEDRESIMADVLPLIRKTDIGSRPVRLVGISISNLSDSPLYEQLALFARTEEGYSYFPGRDRAKGKA